MATVSKSQEVNYSCSDMYALVNDVRKYAEFLPHCAESTVHYEAEDEMKATLVIEAAGMKQPFTTHNLLQPDKMIEIRLLDGPFEHLGGFWRFTPTEKGCFIAFDLEFEFKGKMFSMILGPIFEKVMEQVVEAFCKRAEALYDGKR